MLFEMKTSYSTLQDVGHHFSGDVVEVSSCCASQSKIFK